MTIIHYTSKEALYPKFGYTDGKMIHIREDLSERVKEFVTAHEFYHIKDSSTNRLWREIKASVVPGVSDPIGLAATILASLRWYRIKFYIGLIRGK